jgi:hypothetical protein
MSDPTVLPFSYDQVPVGGLDRRVAVRYPGNPDAACQAITSPAGILPAWVRDISAVGVALLINREFAAGTVLTIELSNPVQGVACLLRARVVHTLELPPDGRWLHGCAFERTLTDQELQAFAD